MPKKFLVRIAAVLVCVIAAAGIAFIMWPGLFGMRGGAETSAALSPAELQNLKLEASIKDGQLTGSYVNRNQDVAVVQLTIEAVTGADGNAQNRTDSRFFTVAAGAAPGAKSAEFRVATGALTPGTRTLRVAEGRGSPHR